MIEVEAVIQRIAAIIDPPAFDISLAVYYSANAPSFNDPARVKRRRIALAKARKIAAMPL